MKEVGDILDLNNVLEVKNRNEFRRWLKENHHKEKECWVFCKRGKPTDDSIFWYLDAVEEALCFGWIDSTTKKLEAGTIQRFTPRSKNSVWSELNKERCRRLERLGLMTDAGKKVLPDMTDQGFIIDPKILKELKKDLIIWNNFLSFPILYQRVRIDTIQIKKKDSILFEKRIKKLISNTKKGVMYGNWNDYGRLIEE